MFRKYKANLREKERRAILLQKKTNSQVLIAYYWRKYWVSSNLQYADCLSKVLTQSCLIVFNLSNKFSKVPKTPKLSDFCGA